MLLPAVDANMFVPSSKYVMSQPPRMTVSSPLPNIVAMRPLSKCGVHAKPTRGARFSQSVGAAVLARVKTGFCTPFSSPGWKSSVDGP